MKRLDLLHRTALLSCLLLRVLQDPHHGEGEHGQKDKNDEAEGIATLAQIVDGESRAKRPARPSHPLPTWRPWADDDGGQGAGSSYYLIGI